VFHRQALTLALLVVFLVGAAPELNTAHYVNTRGPVPEKEVGLWIKQNRPDSILMARKPRTAFYGEARYVSLPFASLNEIVRFARLRGAQILVLDEKYTTSRGPHLSFLLEDGATADGLRRLRTWDSVEGRRFVAFEFAEAFPQ
jgi:hypothetical protein